MKRIEEIRDMDIDSLERIAGDSSVDVPAGLEQKLLSAIVASSEAGCALRRNRVLKMVSGVTATGIAACLAIVLAMSGRPKDTFDDPKLAYAELERTLYRISVKVERGLEMAAEVAPAVELTDRTINGKIEIE